VVLCEECIKYTKYFVCFTTNATLDFSLLNSIFFSTIFSHAKPDISPTMSGTPMAFSSSLQFYLRFRVGIGISLRWLHCSSTFPFWAFS